MKLETKFEPNQVVYAKTSEGGVVKGQISGIAIDVTKQPKTYSFVYLLWVSDRLDNAGHHEWYYEQNLGETFESAYYNADSKLPWDLAESMRWQNIDMIIAKAKSRSEWCPSIGENEVRK